MTDRLAPAQIRGARGMLDWSMLDLAKAAKLSVSTIMVAEGRADVSASAEQFARIRDAFEAEGVRFLSDERNGIGLTFQPR